MSITVELEIDDQQIIDAVTDSPEFDSAIESAIEDLDIGEAVAEPVTGLTPEQAKQLAALSALVKGLQSMIGEHVTLEGDTVKTDALIERFDSLTGAQDNG